MDPGMAMTLGAGSRVAGDVKTGVREKEDARLKEACAGFEAIMLHTMLKAMRQTLPEGGIFDRSQAEEIWESRMDQEIADRISKGAGSPGLRDFLYRQLSRPSGQPSDF
jgi:flagellar protein FlgJ